MASAAIYYLLRQGELQKYGTLRNPVTFAALGFGFVSLVLSVATIYHTELEGEVAPSNVRNGAKYGRKELLITFVETYPEYIRQNDRRLETDRLLLSGAQFSLVLAVLSTLVTVLLFVDGWRLEAPGVVLAIVGGFVTGSACTIVASGLAGTGDRRDDELTRTTKSDARKR